MKMKLYITSCEREKESLTAKALAEAGLYDACKIRAVLCHKESGKPYFENEPNIFVSISHSGGLCIAAISRGEVGVDIEAMVKDSDRLLPLAGRYFAPDEYEYTKSGSAERFYRVWCAKESYIKYTGEGLSRGLSSFSVLSLSGITEEVCFSHLLYENHMIAVCSKKDFAGVPVYIKVK